MRALAASTPPPVGDWRTRRDRIGAFLRRLDGALPERRAVLREPTVVRAADGVDLPALWYRPGGSSPVGGPAALFLHGGGMILGSVAATDRAIATYADLSGIPLLAVDYRLAPECPYPAPVEDAYAALCALAESGADPDRLGIVGESAGGGLAAGVTLLARERGGPRIARQLLIYPMLDDRTASPDEAIGDAAVWTVEDNRTGWDALLGAARGAPNVPFAAAPARCRDLSGLPTAYVEVGQLDIFRAEAVAYAERLTAAGVCCDLRVMAGVPHSYEWIVPDADVSRRAFAERVRQLRAL